MDNKYEIDKLQNENRLLKEKEQARRKKARDKKRIYRANQKRMNEKKLKMTMTISEDPSLNSAALCESKRFDIIVHHFLRENVIKLSLERRIEMTKSKFRTMIPYATTYKALKKKIHYILQCQQYLGGLVGSKRGWIRS